MNLINQLKNHLPFEARVNPGIIKQLKREGKNIKNKVMVEEVYDTKEYGGIVCVTSYKNEALVFSLTHLSIDDTHPLSKEIKEYQSTRILQLQRGVCSA